MLPWDTRAMTSPSEPTTNNAPPIPSDSAGLVGRLLDFADRNDLEWVRDAAEDLEALDLAVYGAVAGVATPTLDTALRRLARGADFSKLWFGGEAPLLESYAVSRDGFVLRTPSLSL